MLEDVQEKGDDTAAADNRCDKKAGKLKHGQYKR